VPVHTIICRGEDTRIFDKAETKNRTVAFNTLGRMIHDQVENGRRLVDMPTRILFDKRVFVITYRFERVKSVLSTSPVTIEASIAFDAVEWEDYYGNLTTE
jgi:hypothetical protein